MKKRHLTCLVSIISSGLSAQSDVWTQIATGGPSVAYESPNAMVYDSSRSVVVLFDGTNTWERTGSTWSQIPTANRPSSRVRTSMVYVASLQKVMLFGGSAAPASGYMSDTWLYDGSNWTQQTSAFSPGQRGYAAIAYDSNRDRVVLFGGLDYGGFGFLNDTWEWSAATGWYPVLTSNSPSPRWSPSMEYSSSQGVCVMTGGITGGYAGDTWHFNGNAWSQVPASVAGIYEHKLVRNPTSNTLHLIGGTEYTNGNAWKHRILSGGQWQSVGTSTPMPWARWPGACWDAARQVVIMQHQGTTWEFGPSPLAASASTYGTGCGSPSLSFTPDQVSRPVIGGTGKATIANPPTLIGGVAMGWSNTRYGSLTLPVPMVSIGMGMCLLLQSGEWFGRPVTPINGGQLEYSCSIPNSASLVGAHVYIQAYCYSPGANPLEFVASNGIDWLIGNQ